MLQPVQTEVESAAAECEGLIPEAHLPNFLTDNWENIINLSVYSSTVNIFVLSR